MFWCHSMEMLAFNKSTCKKGDGVQSIRAKDLSALDMGFPNRKEPGARHTQQHRRRRMSCCCILAFRSHLGYPEPSTLNPSLTETTCGDYVDNIGSPSPHPKP